MINAARAREIQQAAQAEQDAYVRAVIVREVEDICEVIARAARGRNNSCHIIVVKIPKKFSKPS